MRLVNKGKGKTLNTIEYQEKKKEEKIKKIQIFIFLCFRDQLLIVINSIIIVMNYVRS